MHAQDAYRASAVIPFPEQIDLTSRERVYDRLYTALAFGVPVVIADLSDTAFSDCASLRRLVTVHNRAAAQDAQLRIVIAPGSAVQRLAALISLDRRIRVYPSLTEALQPQLPAEHSPLPAGSRPGRRCSPC